LIRDLDQPECRLGTDAAQRPTVSSIKEPIGQTDRNARNGCDIVETERATCHQVPQLRPERARINPSIGRPTAIGEPRHTTAPFVEAFYL
jgi:hypothetical protein